MRVFQVIVCAGFALCFRASEAISTELSDKALAAASHVGQVLAAVDICPGLAMDDAMVSLMIIATGADLKDPLIKAVIVRKRKEAVDAWRGQPKDVACLSGLMLYGPSGANVPGLVRAR